MPSSALPDKSPLRVHRRSTQNAFPRASSFTSNTRILHTSTLHITADQTTDTSNPSTTNRGAIGGASFIAAADHLEGKFSVNTQPSQLQAPTPPTTPTATTTAAPVPTHISTNKPPAISKKKKRAAVPQAPSLNGLTNSSTFVPRHGRIFKTKLKDLSPVIQATHPVVRGVAVYTKSDGTKVEVDVQEYVTVLNEEILRLREEVRVLKETKSNSEGNKRLKRVGTFLKKGRSGSSGADAINGKNAGDVNEVGKRNSMSGGGGGGGASSSVVGEKPVLEAKPAVSFPKQIGAPSTVGEAAKFPTLKPKPAVSFPAPPMSAAATPEVSSRGGPGGNSGVGPSTVAKTKFVSFSKKKVEKEKKDKEEKNKGRSQRKKDDPMTAALSAVESYELKKPPTLNELKKTTTKTTGANPGKNSKGNVATVRGKDIDRHVKEVQKKIGAQSTFIKPKQQKRATNASGVEKTDGAVSNASDGDRKGSGGLGATAGRRLKKGLSFMNRGNTGSKSRRSVNVNNLNKADEEKAKAVKGAVEVVRVDVTKATTGASASANENSAPKENATPTASMPTPANLPTPVTVQPAASKKTSARRRIFSTFIRGKR